MHYRLRITSAFRMLASVTTGNTQYEYLHTLENSILVSLKSIRKKIVTKFGDEYLRAPSVDYLKGIVRINAVYGFPGCADTTTCQHWEWKNCLVAYTGQFKGEGKEHKFVLEVISEKKIRIWHHVFGSPESLSDMSVVDNASTIRVFMARAIPPDV